MRPFNQNHRFPFEAGFHTFVIVLLTKKLHLQAVDLYQLNRSQSATLLLALFLFTLGSQWAHQLINTPAATGPCDRVDFHYHQDTSCHECSLCDYKISAEEISVFEATVLPQFSTYHYPSVTATPIDQFFLLTNKGPPNS